MYCILQLIAKRANAFFLSACAAENTFQKYIEYLGNALYTEVYHYNPTATEAIIFLHGLCGNHADGAFLQDPKNTYMTITMDMPGHGQSGRQDKITWEEYIGAVKAVINSYGLLRVHLIGHSLGADTALMFAKEHPEAVGDIILLDRGYYNYADVIGLHFTPSFYKVVEHDAESGLDTNAFFNLVDMMFENDITKTWDINKDVLLMAANPYWPAPIEGKNNIVDYIEAIKSSPEDFGVSKEQAATLPDLTLDNLYGYMAFLNLKIDEFTSANKKFEMVRTPFEHAMMRNDIAKIELLKDVLLYIGNKDKVWAKDKIKESIYKIKSGFKQKSLSEILGKTILAPKK